MEFLLSCPETTEMINGGPCRRECERFKWLREHLFQIVLGCDANGDVRVEVLAALFRHEVGHVFNQCGLNVAALLGGNEGRGGSGFRRERRYGVDYFLLQPAQIVRRFDDNACEANLTRRM